MFKKFFTSIVRSLIVILILTFIFSAVSANFKDLIKDIFGDIYEYADSDVQQQVISNLAETCSSLEQGNNLVTFNELCSDRNLLDEMRKNCGDYRTLKGRNIELEGKESLMPDFSGMDTLCRNYEDGKISGKEFFSNFIQNSFGNQEMEIPGFEFFEKYNKAVKYLDSNKIIYFAILLILLIILYLLVGETKLFLIILSGILFSTGIFILLPYFGILAYDNYISIDTTSILGSLFGEGNIFDPNALISILLITFLKNYNKAIITLGIIFLIVGVIGKVYGFISDRKAEQKNK